MKTFLKAMTLATLSVSGLAVLPAPAIAQATGGVGVADLDRAVADSAAFTAAIAQIKTTYATQIAAVDARQKVLQGELAPLVTKFQTDQKAATPNRAALQTQYSAIQAKQAAAQDELQRMSIPFDKARAYAVEQITAKLNPAVKTAMTARNVALIVSPQAAVSYAPAADLTTAITAELNKTVPTVSIAVPANWQPGQAQQAAAAPGR